VNYIQELLNKIKEKESPMECTSLTACEKRMETDISEPAVVKTFAITLMKKTSFTMDAAVQTTSEAESVTPEEVGSPEEELLASPEEKMELLVRPEEEMELLARVEELPEFNSVEDLTKWLEMDDNTPSEDLSPEEEMELLGSPEEELLESGQKI
jgi:hypothetical protein